MVSTAEEEVEEEGEKLIYRTRPEETYPSKMWHRYVRRPAKWTCADSERLCSCMKTVGDFFGEGSPLFSSHASG